MATIGDISKCGEFVIEWSVRNFTSYYSEKNKLYKSHAFSIDNETWYLQIVTLNECNGTEYVNISLCRESTDPLIRREFTLGLKTAGGKIHPQYHATWDFSGRNHLYSVLLGKKSELPSDRLTLVCRMKCEKSIEFQSSNKTGTTKCSYCNEVLGVGEDISSHFRKCEDLPIKCPKCDDDIPLKNLYNHKCLVTESEDDCAVYQDFKKMLLDGRNYDLTLKVGGKELRAHQDVLSVRSHVFESMLSHDTTEKERGVIDIPDCDPQAMELFLLYVYSGKLEKLDQTNMTGLYYIADKYDVRGLKAKCCDFIMKSLSHTNICEVIQLALNHSDTSLLEYATEYFMEHTVDIMLTVEWQSFLKGNSTVGNELLLKSFQKVKESKK